MNKKIRTSIVYVFKKKVNGSIRTTSAEITWPVFILDRVRDSSNNAANDSDMSFTFCAVKKPTG